MFLSNTLNSFNLKKKKMVPTSQVTVKLQGLVPLRNGSTLTRTISHRSTNVFVEVKGLSTTVHESEEYHGYGDRPSTSGSNDDERPTL